MRKVLGAFEEHCAHLHLPRPLASKLRSFGFEVVDQQVSPYFNSTFDEDSFNFHAVRIITPFVTGRNGLSESEVDEWQADLSAVAERGEYFFCLNQFLFSVIKPQESQE